MPPLSAQSLKSLVSNTQGLQSLMSRRLAAANIAQQAPKANLMLFGAPGVGKGTFAKMIQKDFDFKPFSTGDYFRHIVKMSKSNVGEELDPFSQNISNILASGKLVDDQIVVDIVRQLSEHPDQFMDGAFNDSRGLILDGVPRTVKQAELLSEFMSIDLVVNFFNLDEIVVAKIMGRRICPECNKNFNVTDIDFSGYRMPPLLPKGDDPTICDEHDHPVKLIQREDDREEIVRERLEIYKKETLPILDFYKSRDETVIVDFETKKGKKDYPVVKQLLMEAFGTDLLLEKDDSLDDILKPILGQQDQRQREQQNTTASAQVPGSH